MNEGMPIFNTITSPMYFIYIRFLITRTLFERAFTSINLILR